MFHFWKTLMYLKERIQGYVLDLNQTIFFMTDHASLLWQGNTPSSTVSEPVLRILFHQYQKQVKGFQVWAALCRLGPCHSLVENQSKRKSLETIQNRYEKMQVLRSNWHSTTGASYVLRYVKKVKTNDSTPARSIRFDFLKKRLDKLGRHFGILLVGNVKRSFGKRLCIPEPLLFFYYPRSGIPRALLALKQQALSRSSVISQPCFLGSLLAWGFLSCPSTGATRRKKTALCFDPIFGVVSNLLCGSVGK